MYDVFQARQQDLPQGHAAHRSLAADGVVVRRNFERERFFQTFGEDIEVARRPRARRDERVEELLRQACVQRAASVRIDSDVR